MKYDGWKAAAFDRACLRCGIDSSNFKQSDLDRLKELLNK